MSVNRRGVIFFNHNTKYLLRLLVSLYSLRAHSSLPAVILDTGAPEAEDVLRQIAGDHRLLADVRKIPMRLLRRNSCYVRKASLWRDSPFEQTLLVDSDTLFLADPQALLDSLESAPGGIVFTAFSDWKTTGRTIAGRIERWREIAPELVKASLEKTYKAINTGVVAWARGSEFLPEWESLTSAGWRCPFTDELAAQLLLRAVPHGLAGQEWNSSVLYGLRDVPPKIVHYHGDKHLRPEDGGRWVRAHQEAMAANAGNVAAWGASP